MTNNINFDCIGNRMKGLKILLSILFLFLFVFSISAQSTVQTLGVYKQHECINLIQICSSCTYNNVSTVISPNSTILMSNILMQKSGTFYNQTFCNTSQLGRYIVNGFGDVSGIVTVWSYDFYITSSGTQLGTSDSLMSMLFFGAILLIAIIMFMLAFVFRGPKGLWISLFFLSMGIILVVIDFGYIMNIMDRYQENMGYASPFFNTIYFVMTIMLIAGGIAVVVGLLVDSLTKFKSMRYGDSV